MPKAGRGKMCKLLTVLVSPGMLLLLILGTRPEGTEWSLPLVLAAYALVHVFFWPPWFATKFLVRRLRIQSLVGSSCPRLGVVGSRGCVRMFPILSARWPLPIRAQRPAGGRRCDTSNATVTFDEENPCVRIRHFRSGSPR